VSTTFTIDASVFLNAFNPYEAGYQESSKLLTLLQETATPIIVPTLLLPEVAAGIARGSKDTDLATRFATALSRLPHIVFVPVDESLARRAAELAARYRLRGADAIYAAVALRFGSTLVTLDRQQRERVAEAVPTRWPTEALADYSSQEERHV
jgi:predicted nucleic acid-binding protein